MAPQQNVVDSTVVMQSSASSRPPFVSWRFETEKNVREEGTQKMGGGGDGEGIGKVYNLFTAVGVAVVKDLDRPVCLG